MSRQALLVGASVAGETVLEQTLKRYGYSRIAHADTLEHAAEQFGRTQVDLLVLPIDEVEDSALALIEKTAWRDHGLRIIATGPSTDAQLIMRAMRSGIKEYLVRPIVVTDCVSAVERLHKRTEVGETTGQVFALYCAKGGIGVSTTSVNLASGIATMHPASRVAVADLGVPGGDTSLLLNVRPSYTMGNIAERIDQLDDELLNSVLAPAGNGLWVLAAPERPEQADDIDANVVASVLALMRTSFDYTVLDCEHQMNDRTVAALDAADRILLLTELTVQALRSAQRSLGVFRRLGYPAEKLAIVVNRHRSGDIVSLADAQEVLKEEIFFKIPNDYRVVSEASTAGVPVEVKDPHSPLTFAYRQLAQKLTGGTMPVVHQPTTGNGSRSRIRELFARKRS